MQKILVPKTAVCKALNSKALAQRTLQTSSQDFAHQQMRHKSEDDSRAIRRTYTLAWGHLHVNLCWLEAYQSRLPVSELRLSSMRKQRGPAVADTVP